MPVLTVINRGVTRETPFSPGFSLREILDAADIQVRSGCLGNGACGLCLVQIEAGTANDPTASELLNLSPEQIGENIRLACQARPENDLRVRIVGQVFNPDWRELAPERLSPASPSPDVENRSKRGGTEYGLAVDLGTTHISLSLWDMDRGLRLFGRGGMNPQSYYGSDVMTRLIAADASPDNAAKLARMPFDAIFEALLDMSARDGFSLAEVTRVNIVGNTSMLALLTQTDPRVLLQPRSWTRPVELTREYERAWKSVLGVHPQATVEIVLPYAGFVGSDLLAGALATGLTERPGDS